MKGRQMFKLSFNLLKEKNLHICQTKVSLFCNFSDENDKTVSNGDKGSEVSGSDSLEDYGKVDSLKFNEEGSIIGQSGSQELKEAS